MTSSGVDTKVMNDYAAMAAAVYKDKKGRQSLVDALTQYGYVLEKGKNRKEFAAFQGRDKDEVVVAIRGTDFSAQHGQGDRGKDFFSDGALTLGFSTLTPRYRRAQRFLRGVMEANPGKKIVIVGHSLGGELAKELSHALPANVNVESHSFNSGSSPLHILDPVLPSIDLDKEKKKARSHSYFSSNITMNPLSIDPLSVAGLFDDRSTNHIVKQKQLPDSDANSVLRAHSVYHFLDAPVLTR